MGKGLLRETYCDTELHSQMPLFLDWADSQPAGWILILFLWMKEELDGQIHLGWFGISLVDFENNTNHCVVSVSCFCTKQAVRVMPQTTT